MTAALKAGALALAFLLELCMLVALGYWGFNTGNGALAHIALGIGVPLLAAVVWGLLLAPKAPITLPAPAHFLLAMAIFALAALALAAAGQPTLAWIFAVVVALNQVTLRLVRS